MTVALIAQTLALIAAMVFVARWSIAPLGAGVDGLEAKMDARFAGLEAKMDARFETVDHRLSSVEGDMSLIKQHLLSQRAG